MDPKLASRSLNALTSGALLAASTVVAFADDPRAFIGEEFSMRGVVCSNVLDTQKLGQLLITGQINVDKEILNTVADNQLTCKFIDQAAMYTGPVARSEFVVTGRRFIIDQYVPVEGVDDFYVWRELRTFRSLGV